MVRDNSGTDPCGNIIGGGGMGWGITQVLLKYRPPVMVDPLPSKEQTSANYR